MRAVSFKGESYRYEDIYGAEAELTIEQINWFYGICEDARKATGMNIRIYCCNHDEIKGHENDLGMFWAPVEGDEVSLENSFITVDTYTIYECYEHTFHDMPVFRYTELEEIIAHEMAHFIKFRHCKTHSRITKEFYDKIKDYQKNKEEKILEKKSSGNPYKSIKECGLRFIFRYLDGLTAIWLIRSIEDTKDMLLWYFNLECIIGVDIYFDDTLIAHFEKDGLEAFMKGLNIFE